MDSPALFALNQPVRTARLFPPPPGHTHAHMRQVSLKDSNTGRRIGRPATSVDCHHVQCFDLEHFLRGSLAERKPTWRCPLCRVPMRPGAVRLDHLWEAMLDSVGPEDEFVEVHHDGSWVAIRSVDRMEVIKHYGEYEAAQKVTGSAAEKRPRKALDADSPGPVASGRESAADRDRDRGRDHGHDRDRHRDWDREHRHSSPQRADREPKSRRIRDRSPECRAEPPAPELRPAASDPRKSAPQAAPVAPAAASAGLDDEYEQFQMLLASECPAPPAAPPAGHGPVPVAPPAPPPPAPAPQPRAPSDCLPTAPKPPKAPVRDLDEEYAAFKALLGEDPPSGAVPGLVADYDSQDEADGAAPASAPPPPPPPPAGPRPVPPPQWPSPAPQVEAAAPSLDSHATRTNLCPDLDPNLCPPPNRSVDVSRSPGPSSGPGPHNSYPDPSTSWGAPLASSSYLAPDHITTYDKSLYLPYDPSADQKHTPSPGPDPALPPGAVPSAGVTSAPLPPTPGPTTSSGHSHAHALQTYGSPVGSPPPQQQFMVSQHSAPPATPGQQPAPPPPPGQQPAPPPPLQHAPPGQQPAPPPPPGAPLPPPGQHAPLPPPGQHAPLSLPGQHHAPLPPGQQPTLMLPHGQQPVPPVHPGQQAPGPTAHYWGQLFASS